MEKLGMHFEKMSTDHRGIEIVYYAKDKLGIEPVLWGQLSSQWCGVAESMYEKDAVWFQTLVETYHGTSLHLDSYLKSATPIMSGDW